MEEVIRINDQDQDDAAAAAAGICPNMVNDFISFPRLKSLMLISLRNLESFYGGGTMKRRNNFLFGTKVTFPSLKVLRIYQLGNIEGIWENASHIQASFCELRELRVEECDNLENVISPTILGRLQNLKKLEVVSCKSMRYIAAYSLSSTIAKTNEKMEEVTNGIKATALEEVDIVFPQLKSMELSNLQNLTSFWDYGQEEREHEGSKHFFNKTALLSMDLVELVVFDLGNKCTDVIFKGCLSASSRFTLRIWSCGNGPSVVSTELLRRIGGSLEILNVGRCDMATQVFDLEGLNADDGQLLSSLTTLYLIELPNLQMICNSWDTLHGREIIAFKSLTVVRIERCNLLSHLFPCSVARALEKLKFLVVKSNDMMEKVILEDHIEPQQGKQVGGEIVFPQLKYLELVKLPKLTCFSNTTRVVSVPSLTELRFEECPEMQTFTWGQISMSWVRMSCSNGNMFCVKDLNACFRHRAATGKWLLEDDYNADVTHLLRVRREMLTFAVSEDLFLGMRGINL